MFDFMYFQKEIITNRQGTWDKDMDNTLSVGDYLGFITGPTDNAFVYIYKVIGAGTAEDRPSHWKNNAYNTNNGTNDVDNRIVIFLTDIHMLPKTYEWNSFKKISGLAPNCDSWMPRGTQKVKNHPFSFSLADIDD
jgi:hypothetical protein